MLQQQMLEEVATAFTKEEAIHMSGDAYFLLVVLTKGLLRDSSFTGMILGMCESR